MCASAMPHAPFLYPAVPRTMSDPATSDEATIIETEVEAEERSHANLHGHGPLDMRKALGTGGLSFAPVYNEWDNLQRDHKKGSAVILMSVGLQALTGVLTGLAAVVVGNLSQAMGKARLHVVMGLMTSCSWLHAWLASFGIMAGLALAGALPVILWVRSAGSSGIPTIIGILNGCDLRADFRIGTLLVRLVGVTCAVASGAAVGPEGPMIFIGACIGALFSRIPSSPSVWRYLGRPPSSLNSHVYLRDYISTGAACGIAAAFRAPIAGTLFVIEEAASHFRREHLLKIFLGSLLAMIVANSMSDLLGGKGMFEYKVTTGDACLTSSWFSPSNLFFFVVIGVVCGLAGALFNRINIGASRRRALYAGGNKPVRRLLDLLLLCALTSTCWVGLPLLFSDLPAGEPAIFARGTACIKDTWMPQLVRSATVGNGQVGSERRLRYHPEPCLYGVQYDPVLCPQAHNLSGRSWDVGSGYARTCTEKLIRSNAVGEERQRFYCCNFSSLAALQAGSFQVPANASCPIDLGASFPSLPGSCPSSRRLEGLSSALGGHGEEPTRKSYNPMAALTLVPLDEAAQNLFSRGAPYVLPMGVLMTFLPVFFLLAALTAGSAIPSGLLLPHIIIGALLGRMLAILLIGFQAQLGWYSRRSSEDSFWSDEWLPFFPSMGGPLSDGAPLATSGWIDPGIGAFAGAAAFLGGSSRISLTITVMMVEITGDPMMIAPAGVACLVAVVLGNRINHGLYHQLIDVASFPFLPDRWPKDIPKALRVEHLLPEEGTVQCIALTAQRADVEELLRRSEHTGFPVLDADGVVVGIAMRHLMLCMLEELTDTVDVGRVTDFHYVTIRAIMPLEVAYTLFKRMEISHMIVVDNNHRPVAMLTRSSFLPWNVEVRIGKSLDRVRRTIQRPRSFRHEGSQGLHLEDTFFQSEYSSHALVGAESLNPAMRASGLHESIRASGLNESIQE